MDIRIEKPKYQDGYVIIFDHNKSYQSSEYVRFEDLVTLRTKIEEIIVLNIVPPVTKRETLFEKLIRIWDTARINKPTKQLPK